MYVDKMLLTSNIKDYHVYFVSTTEFMLNLRQIQNCVFIIDKTVWDIYADDCLSFINKLDVIVLSISEERKNLDTVKVLYDFFMERSSKKNTTIVSIGGGITQDITGFLTSTLYRGVKWVFVPTTLLAQADSCIGSKTSLNYRKYKNLIGTFYPPSEIYIYTQFLTTLEPLDYFSGLGEVVKLYIMGGEETITELINLLPFAINRDKESLMKIVKQSLQIKQNYIEGDEFDTGRRNLLNYGHCFGHAIETATNYAIPHGQAVVLGMILSNMISKRRGLLSEKSEMKLAKQLLYPVLLAECANIEVDVQQIITAMKKDKKRTGLELPLIMATEDYKLLRVNDLSEKEACEVLGEFISRGFNYK